LEAIEIIEKVGIFDVTPSISHENALESPERLFVSIKSFFKKNALRIDPRAFLRQAAQFSFLGYSSLARGRPRRWHSSDTVLGYHFFPWLVCMCRAFSSRAMPL